MGKIYRYTLTKYIKAPSTWIILAVSIFIATFLGGYLPFSKFSIDSRDATINYAKLTIIVVAAITSFLALFASVFAGFKAATMFKDEVEDGTFLVMLSKPIDRTRILLGKFLALETVVIIFGYVTSFSYSIATYAFDVGDQVQFLKQYGIGTLSDKVWTIGLIMGSIITLMGFIFSSLGVLLSTKLSVGATIGISIGLSVVIPATSLIGQVTRKEEYKSINSYTSSRSLMNQLYALNSMQHEVPQSQMQDIFTKLKALSDETENPQGIYRLGLSTGEENDFKHLWPFDINFQIQKLASFASDAVVSDLAKNMSADNKKGRPGYSDISFDEDKSSPLASGKGHEEYEFIINYLKHNIHIIYDAMEEILKTSWEIAYKKLNPTLSLMPESLKFNYSSSLKDFIENSLTMDDFNIDLTSNADLLKVWQKDHDHAVKHHATFTSLGYKTYSDLAKTNESVAPHDLTKEWWVSWYKMSQEVHKDAQAHSSDPSYVGQPTFATVWEAVNSVFSRDKGLYAADTNNYNGRTLSEIFGVSTRTLAYKAQHWALDLIKNYLPRIVGTLGQTSAGTALSGIASIMSRAMTPLCTNVIGWKDLDDSFHKQGLKPLPGDKTMMKIGEEISTPSEGKYYNINYDHDFGAINNLLAVAYNHPDKLGQISTKGYVENYTLLWIYLGLAFFMMPMAFLIIKRQDFR